MSDEIEDKELEVALLLSSPSHPIWKIIGTLTAILAALWMNGTV
jgi:hypothetical protein